MPPAALNLLVFRDDRRRVSGLQLKSALIRQIQNLRRASSADQLINALLRAGELECGVSDAALTSVRASAVLTEHLANALINPESALDAGAMQAAIDAAVPGEIAMSSPEGFAYYALHPLAFGDVVEQLPLRSRSVGVIAMSSIGTTLRAVATAAARAGGLCADRITVRPHGHPYNRYTDLSTEQLHFVRKSTAVNAEFLIVDEGPGLSGSSFLSVAEALSLAGVKDDRITLVCGHQPDFASLRADGGSQRAHRCRWAAVPLEARKPEEAEQFVGAGLWRGQLLSDAGAWPASWISSERLKYLTSNHSHRLLLKFIGLGHYGEKVFEREEQIAGAGFGLVPRRQAHGFASYDWIPGRPMSCADVNDGLTEDVLRRLAAYCAFRAETFPVELTGLEAQRQMADHNAQQMALDVPIRLQLERPVIADGRMQPHEWLCTSDGHLVKTDCGSHGDDHFFPGATDIAWDLAGAIVEWRMDDAQARFFLETYRRASGDDPSKRIKDFVTAYTIFRRAYCLMAANALQGTDEQARLERAAAYYQAGFSRRAYTRQDHSQEEEPKMAKGERPRCEITVAQTVIPESRVE